MIKTSLAALAAITFALPVHAQAVCDMQGAEPVPLLEEAKQKFLDSDFSAFLDLMRQSLGDGADNLGQPLSRLQQIIPNGFDSCQVIAQRRDVGGFVQEVVTFNVTGTRQPLSVYLSAMPVRGTYIIGKVNFNTSIGPVLDELK